MRFGLALLRDHLVADENPDIFLRLNPRRDPQPFAGQLIVEKTNVVDGHVSLP
jgi:hypothetical protein